MKRSGALSGKKIQSLLLAGLITSMFARCFAAQETAGPKASLENPPATNAASLDTNAPATAVETNLPRPNSISPRTNAVPATTSVPANSALSGFRTRPGFKIELVASDPSVASPVAMAFDEDGRLFVAEMRDYPSQRNQTPHLGQIRLLEDREGEGVFAASTIFATNLPLPSAVVCYSGGVFVAAAPNILFLQDTDGNGVADVRRIVFTGFGDTNAINPNSLPHSFFWGLDNRIHGATGGAASMISAAGDDASKVLVAGRDFSFDPRTLSAGAEAGLALSGLTRDDWGRKFLCSNARPLQVEVIEDRYVARNPFFAPSSLVEDIAGPAIPVFRYAPPGTGGAAKRRGTNDHAPAWLANARGAVVYRGTLFPSNYHGNIFVADADARVIHRAVIREQGFAVRAERAPEERSTEFLVSTDPTFRPTQIINGPDGALYVADMASGGESGRIYRIATSGYVPQKPARLSTAGPRELAATLVYTNGFQRDTAARLIFENRDPEVTPLLTSMAANSKLPLARALALNALAGMGVLTDIQVSRAMGDADARVRRQGAIFAEGFVRDARILDTLWARLRSMAADPSVHVRMQAALTSGAIARADKAVLLRDVLARDPGNPWIQTAVLSAAHSSGPALLPLLAEEPRIPEAMRAPLLARIAEMVGVVGRMDEVQSVIDYILGGQVPQPVALGLTGALGDGLRRTRSSLRLADGNGRLAPVFTLALRGAMEGSLSESVRLEAVRVLGVGPYTMSDGGAILTAIIGSGESVPMQAAALRSIANYNSPEVAPEVIRKWRGIPASLRGQAIAALMTRTEQVPVILTLIENGNIPVADVLPWQANIFRSWPEPAVSQRAVRLFGPMTADRTVVLEKLRPVVALNGVPSRGQTIFEARCSSCHVVRGGWQTPGPELAGVKVLGKEAILQSIVEPSRRIVPGHVTVVVNTLGGETLVGVVPRETTDSILLAEPGRAPTAWPRLNIENINPQQWSLMPDGLEQGLNNQNMADLLQFLVVSP